MASARRAHLDTELLSCWLTESEQVAGTSGGRSLHISLSITIPRWLFVSIARDTSTLLTWKLFKMFANYLIIANVNSLITRTRLHNLQDESMSGRLVSDSGQHDVQITTIHGAEQSRAGLGTSHLSTPAQVQAPHCIPWLGTMPAVTALHQSGLRMADY